jgi:D-3-phosphoglycerate dehydrogenase
MPRMSTVVITDIAWPSIEIERDVLAPIGAELVLAQRGDEEELVRLAPGADAILTCWQKVTARVLDAAQRCRIVARYGIGLDNIAVDRATELGILVTNVPDFCLDEVSDHAMALLLTAARRVAAFADETRQGVWNPAAGRALPRLRGQTLGLIGFGAIARTLVPKALGFGLEVIAYTPRLRADEPMPGVRAVAGLDELLARADYVSVHAPLTPETRGMIGAAQLGRMKPTAWLINTSRGPIVDEVALVDALRSGRIAGAALDVFAAEPPAADHPLLSLPNTIVTPHVAFASEAAVRDLQRRAAERVAEALRGELPRNVVNPAVVSSPAFRGFQGASGRA